MRKLWSYLIWTKWKVGCYRWPYDPGYNIFRKNRITGQITFVDRYETIREATDAAKQQNEVSL